MKQVQLTVIWMMIDVFFCLRDCQKKRNLLNIKKQTAHLLYLFQGKEQFYELSLFHQVVSQNCFLKVSVSQLQGYQCINIFTILSFIMFYYVQTHRKHHVRCVLSEMQQQQSTHILNSEGITNNRSEKNTLCLVSYALKRTKGAALIHCLIIIRLKQLYNVYLEVVTLVTILLLPARCESLLLTYIKWTQQQ